MNPVPQVVINPLSWLGGAVLIILISMPFWAVTHIDSEFMSVYFWPSSTEEDAFSIMQKANVTLVRRGFKTIYLVTSPNPEGMGKRLREAGAMLILPPGMGLGCDYSVTE